ncbi:MAG TPA: acyl carrier protein [Ktedonobacteraceae bacterium]|nr:acyl carrier protein [Ktedonobacteraceae bacterium]
MQRLTIIEELKRYIAQDVLAGKDIGLDETTPLLEWGIINSLEIVRLLSFVRKQFAVDIPADKLVADSFTSVSCVADLVLEHVPAGAVN